MSDQFDITRPVDELVADIVAMPDGEIPRNLNVGMSGVFRLLKGDLHKLVLVFDAVAKHTEASEWMRGAAVVYKGMALRPNPSVDVVPLMAANLQVIENLKPEGPELKTTGANLILSGLAEYEVGLMLRMGRRYHAAAFAHDRAMGKYNAAGHLGSAMISMFLASVERMTDALVKCDTDIIRERFYHLLRVTSLCDALMSSVEEQDTKPGWYGWFEVNMPLHVAWAAFMASLLNIGCCYPNDESIREACRNSPAKHWKALFELVDLHEDSEWSVLIEQAAAVLETLKTVVSSSITNVRLTVMLLLAEAHTATEEFEVAARVLRDVTRNTMPDGGACMAVAQAFLKDE